LCKGEVDMDCLKFVMGLSTPVSFAQVRRWLCLDLGSLKGGNLYLELVVVLFQRILLSGGVIAVESRLLLVAI